MSDILKDVFEARSIAIIGASNDPAKRGYHAVCKLVSDGYDGAIYPINPNVGEIKGLKAYPSVLAVAGNIDLALICTPAKSLPAILAQCGQKDIVGAVVLAAGFTEIGVEGASMAQAAIDAARAHNVRILGPNTNGIFNLHNKMNLVGVQEVEPGQIGICSQSGNMMLGL
ncbi:MAG: CoA-binding protein, partial [Pseudomonadota bacterium]